MVKRRPTTGRGRGSNRYARKGHSGGERHRSRRASRAGTSRSSRGCSVPRRRGNRKYPDFMFPKTVPQTMRNVKFNSYIRKVLKKIKPNMKMNGDTMKYMDMILKDTLDFIARAASDKMGKRKTLKPVVIKRALKKIMPKTFWVTADEHGQRALDKYMADKRRH